MNPDVIATLNKILRDTGLEKNWIAVADSEEPEIFVATIASAATPKEPYLFLQTDYSIAEERRGYEITRLVHYSGSYQEPPSSDFELVWAGPYLSIAIVEMISTMVCQHVGEYLEWQAEAEQMELERENALESQIVHEAEIAIQMERDARLYEQDPDAYMTRADFDYDVWKEDNLD